MPMLRLAIVLAALAATASPVAAQTPARKPAIDGAPATGTPPPGGAGDAKPAASLSGAWTTRAVTAPDGAFAYCVAQARYDSGHVLVFARTRAGNLNLALGIPGGKLPKDERWTVTVGIDGTLSRETVAVAAMDDLLVIPAGPDGDLFARLGSGRELTVQSAADRISFRLKGTKAALAELKRCADADGAGFAAKRSGPVASPFPETLGAVLAAAGLDAVEPVTLDDGPEGQRPADYAWRLGTVLGGVKEEVPPPDASLESLSDAYVAGLKERCAGVLDARLDPPETLPGMALRTGSVECAQPEGTLHIALLFYRTDAPLFTVFFHEGAKADGQTSDKARDGLARVVRNFAASNAPSKPGDATPAPPAAAVTRP